MREEMWRGDPDCSHPDCKFGRAYIIEPGENRTLKAWCGSHKPEGVYDRAVMVTTCLSASWDDVEEVTLHQLESCFDRRGDLISIKMKDIPNIEMMRRNGIEVLQYLTFMSGYRYSIHHLGQDGEQNDSWICTGFRQKPAVVSIRHKYWGERQIEDFRKLVRTMAQIHEWKLVDETVPLLDRIVQAIE